eukprot:scaffold43513_cov65-Phaeocystis_antarctica.AAC.2
MPAGTRHSLHARSATRDAKVRRRSACRRPALRAALRAALPAADPPPPPPPPRSSAVVAGPSKESRWSTAPGTLRSACSARRRSPLVSEPKKQTCRYVGLQAWARGAAGLGM